MDVQIFIKPLRKPIYLAILIVLTLFFFSLFLIVQIYFTPEYKAQPKLIFLVLKPKDYFLLIIFAFLVAFNFVLSIYNLKFKNNLDKTKSLIQNLPAIFSSLFAGTIATTLCVTCLVSLLSFLGTGAAFGLTIFSLKYKTWLVYGNFIFLGILTFYNLKKLKKNEKECNC